MSLTTAQKKAYIVARIVESQDEQASYHVIASNYMEHADSTTYADRRADALKWAAHYQSRAAWMHVDATRLMEQLQGH